MGGDVRSAARLIRLIDDENPAAWVAVKQLFRHSGRALVVGITGPPGAGKSTLTDCLIHLVRSAGKTVGVLAVDPSSPISGGAILGDRIRMNRFALDGDVFIRSLASRGHFGGVTPATRGAIRVMDAMGKDVVLVETVGVGQDEVDIARLAHTTIVVAVPGLGDDVQAMKAGILEVGDLFVVNKADHPEADNTVAYLENIFRRSWRGDWVPPVLKAEALHDRGTEGIWQAIERHALHRGEGGSSYLERQHNDTLIELRAFLRQGMQREISRRLDENPEIEESVKQIVDGDIDIYAVAEQILSSVGPIAGFDGDSR
ncbi:MAG: methylmalonyl Co-A mutase-associated GTPase MeaB [Actinomycetia bacterium]|nr:methylmalonyl Co-A mutase-associated GTPase MeaB [Actinomycetes bacterium]MCP4961332.1 methylmalonyl Co-A mutase-associated GTPase MeaB [Actinomycetes bacterium]